MTWRGKENNLGKGLHREKPAETGVGGKLVAISMGWKKAKRRTLLLVFRRVGRECRSRGIRGQEKGAELNIGELLLGCGEDNREISFAIGPRAEGVKKTVGNGDRSFSGRGSRRVAVYIEEVRSEESSPGLDRFGW